MTTMRKYMNLFEDFEQKIDEAGAGPSRIVQHVRDGAVFFMLSAMRANLDYAQNKRRTEKLESALKQLPVSFIRTTGEYQEEGQPEPSTELSFFVMPRRGSGAMVADAFRKFGIKLMHAFEQDSILFGDGKSVGLIFSDGTTMNLGDHATFRADVISQLGGYSKIKGRQFSFTDKDMAGKAKQDNQPATTKGVAYGATG